MTPLKKSALSVAICFFAFLAYLVTLAETGRAATGAVVDEYYNRYNSGEFDYIRDSMLTAGAKDTAFNDALRVAYGKLGKNTARNQKSFKMLDLRGSRYYYRFDASYEKGSATDSFVLVKDPAGYKLENLPNSYFPCLGRE